MMAMPNGENKRRKEEGREKAEGKKESYGERDSLGEIVDSGKERRGHIMHKDKEI